MNSHILKKLWFRLYIGGLITITILHSCSTNPKSPNLKKGINFNEQHFDSILGYLNKERTSYDIKFYELDIKIFPEKKRIEGNVVISLTFVSKTDQIQFELAENFLIHNISNNISNNILKYNRSSKKILIDFEQEYDSGEKLSIRIDYSGKPQIAKKPPWKGGFIWDKSGRKPFVGVACEDDGASIWWPLKDHISDKPDSAKMAFTIPKGLYCVSNGRLIDRVSVNAQQEKFVWKTSYPINTYNITFYIGDYIHFTLPYEGNYGKHELDFYVLPENLDKAKLHFEQTKNVLSVFEELFGEYPWWKDGYKLVESPYQGMEHQTAIAYGDRYKNGALSNYDYIIVHETAHEWWGNKITVCDMADLWIHEGFATYSEALYSEFSFGYEEYLSEIRINRLSTLNKLPMVGPLSVSYKNFKDGDIYSKGACLLHSLRTSIKDDSLFFKIIYKFSSEYGRECVNSEDFIRLVNQMTSNDFNWLFDQYLHRPEIPELLYKIVINQFGRRELLFKWNSNNTNANFKLPIIIKSDYNKIILQPSHELQKIKYNIDKAYFPLDQLIIFTYDKSLKNTF